jgi:NAD(P)-dependent dehydrogenase (short-subunit alcohol dehydrogenase family)
MKMTQSTVVIISGASRGVGAAAARWLTSTGSAAYYHNLCDRSLIVVPSVGDATSIKSVFKVAFCLSGCIWNI